MDEVAKALLDLSWSDMDDFAQRLHDAVVTNDEVEVEDIDPRFVAQVLIDWAHENSAT